MWARLGNHHYLLPIQVFLVLFLVVVVVVLLAAAEAKPLKNSARLWCVSDGEARVRVSRPVRWMPRPSL